MGDRLKFDVDTLVIFVRVAAPLCAVIYVVAAVLASDPLVFAIAQAIYFFAGVAAVTSLLSVAIGTDNDRERGVWGLLAGAIALFLAGTAARLGAGFLGSQAESLRSANHTMWVLGIVLVGVTMYLAGRQSVLPPSSRWRIMLDICILTLITYVCVHYFWIDSALGLSPDALRESFVVAFDLVIGLVGYVALAVAVRNVPARGYSSWHILLAAGLVSLFTGMVILSLLQMLSLGLAPSVRDLLGQTGEVVAYLLFAGAGLLRTRGTGRVWRASWLRRDANAMPGVIIAGIVLLAIPLVGVVVLGTSRDSSARTVYLVIASVAMVALVIRSALASAEADEMRTRAYTDSVTGLYNSASFRERLDELVKMSRRNDRPFALVMIDLDEFAVIEMPYGRDAGDRLLASVASALESVAGDHDSVFRVTGDEFAVLLWDCDVEQVALEADRLLDVIHKVPIGLRRLTASAGVAVFPRHAEDRESLIRCAEGAEVWAKYHGKDRVVVFDDGVVHSMGIDERLNLDERRSRTDVMLALSAAANARDPKGRMHARNVAALSVLLGEEIGFDGEMLELLETAAVLHDVGKIATQEVPTSVKRRARLHEHSLRDHPALGAQLVESAGFEQIAPWVRAHHENWDGSGYPDGMRGIEIPIPARVIALANAYDLLTSDAGGTPALSKSAALQEIDLGIGTRFDPDLAEKFIAVVGATRALGWRDRSWRDAV